MWIGFGKNGRVSITILTTALNWSEMCVGCGCFILERAMPSVQ